MMCKLIEISNKTLKLWQGYLFTNGLVTCLRNIHSDCLILMFVYWFVLVHHKRSPKQTPKVFWVKWAVIELPVFS